VAVVDFSHETGPTLFGSHEKLLAEWREKLGRSAVADAAQRLPQLTALANVAARSTNEEFQSLRRHLTGRNRLPDAQGYELEQPSRQATQRAVAAAAEPASPQPP